MFVTKPRVRQRTSRATLGHERERLRRVQLHVRPLQLAVNAADNQSFLGPVELECFAQIDL